MTTTSAANNNNKDNTIRDELAETYHSLMIKNIESTIDYLASFIDESKDCRPLNRLREYWKKHSKLKDIIEIGKSTSYKDIDKLLEPLQKKIDIEIKKCKPKKNDDVNHDDTQVCDVCRYHSLNEFKNELSKK